MKKLLTIAFSLAMCLSAHGASTQVNVFSFGAKGDGVTDDTIAFQSAINAAASLKQSLLVPSGNYVVGPLTITPGIREIVGVGTTGTKHPSQAGTRLVLKTNANATMITVPTAAYCDFYKICFDGNRTNQTVATPIIDVQPVNYIGVTPLIRNEMKISGCDFCESKGAGVRIRREEVYLEQANAVFNDGNGVEWLSASDCSAVYLGTGHNGGDGMYFGGNCSAFRMTQCDTYSNHGHGMNIAGGPIGDIDFIRFQANGNWKSGVWMTGIVARVSFLGGYIGGNNYDLDYYGTHTPYASGTWPDVMIGDSAYTTAIAFTGVELGVQSGAPSTTKPSTALFDGRTTGTLTNGVGISIIGGVLPRGTGTTNTGNYYTGQTYWPATIPEHAQILGVNDSSGGAYPTRLGQGQIMLSGPLVMDGVISTNTNTMSATIYFPLTNSPTLTFKLQGISNTVFMTLFEDGLLSLPGGISTLGSITNNGNLLNNGLLRISTLSTNATNSSILIYSVADTNNVSNGDIGFVANYANIGGTNQFFAMRASGAFEYPGQLLPTFGVTTNQGDLLVTGTLSVTGTIDLLSVDTLNATNIQSSGLPGITTTWTNLISGVITQRITAVNGLIVTNLTL